MKRLVIHSQTRKTAMNTAALLPSLSMFTLLVVFLVLVIGFGIFWSKRANRAPKDGGPPTKDGSI
jgi:preprotein translocase subunit SecG